MFSFFKSSKKSPVVSPVEQRSDESLQKNSDEFEVINPNPTNNIYPSVNPPNPQPIHPFNRQFSVSLNYTQNVPFKLNPAIVTGNNDDDVWNYKLREMNSILQRINFTDYDFKLERSIVES